MAASITGATPRQLYDMTYRLVNQRAAVTSTRGTFTGRLLGGKWRGTATPYLTLSSDNQPGVLQIPFETIKRIELIN